MKGNDGKIEEVKLNEKIKELNPNQILSYRSSSISNSSSIISHIDDVSSDVDIEKRLKNKKGVSKLAEDIINDDNNEDDDDKSLTDFMFSEDMNRG